MAAMFMTPMFMQHVMLMWMCSSWCQYSCDTPLSICCSWCQLFMQRILIMLLMVNGSFLFWFFQLSSWETFSSSLHSVCFGPMPIIIIALGKHFDYTQLLLCMLVTETNGLGLYWLGHSYFFGAHLLSAPARSYKKDAKVRGGSGGDRAACQGGFWGHNGRNESTICSKSSHCLTATKKWPIFWRDDLRSSWQWSSTLTRLSRTVLGLHVSPITCQCFNLCNSGVACFQGTIKRPGKVTGLMHECQNNIMNENLGMEHVTLISLASMIMTDMIFISNHGLTNFSA